MSGAARVCVAGRGTLDAGREDKNLVSRFALSRLVSHVSHLVVVALCAAAALPSLAAVPADGGEWAIGAGESETLDAAATISRLAVDGSLTLDTGAALVATGAVVNCISTGDGMVADMTIASGASFVSQGNLTGENPGNTQGFSIGTYGGTGTVTVASGGTLTVTGGRLFLGRNSLTDANGADRTKLSQGVLNIFGTVSAPTIECGAWFATRSSGTTYDLDAIPVASIINLEEGGVLETGIFQNNDVTRNVINFKGGVFRVSRQPANPFFSGAQTISTIWRIESGKSLVFDTQSWDTVLDLSWHQDDSFKLVGEGGLVKRGSGLLDIRLTHQEMNTFTGPIVVEGGSLRLGRPLAEGQTVLVKSGAKFYPVCDADVAKISYEDPADAPNGAVFHVDANFSDGLDLLSLSPAYLTDKLGGPTANWNGEVHGAVTHAAGIDLAHPFELVGLGNTLTLDGTGLDDLPLTVSGTGTFVFSGNHTTSTDSAITFTGAATYRQSGDYNVQGENGAMPVMTISGGGTFTTTGALNVGYNGCDGELVVSNGVNVTVGGDLYVGGNASTRQTVRGRMTIESATVTASGAIHIGPNCLTDGSDRTTLMNELVLKPGAVLSATRIARHDDPRAQITFDGGKFVSRDSRTDTFYSGQDGILEIVPTAGNDIELEIGSYNAGIIKNHTHVFGDGGLHVKGKQGSGGTFYLGANGLSDFELDYRGTTTIEDCTLRIGVPLPAATTVTGTRAILYLDNVTTTNNVAGDVAIKGSGALVIGADGQDCAFTNKIDEGVTLVKIGAGTLTFPDGFNGRFVVKEGTAVVRGIAYRSYRFKLEGVRGPDADAVQLSELKLLDGAADVTRPYARLDFDTTGAVSGKIYPANESPAKLVDGNTSTKWLDFRILSSHPESDHDKAWLRIDYPSLRQITGYSWYTANDFPVRDPSAWRLQGSNDGGATWTDIDVQTGFSAPDGRTTLAGTFAGFGALGSSARAIVEPGATLRVTGAIPASAIENAGGTVELAEGATLASDGGKISGGLAGAGSIGVMGGYASFSGTQSYTGETHVFGGTLDIGVVTNPAERASFEGKYFRLTIKRSSSNGASITYKYGNKTTTDGGAIQASEFQLYDAEGNNVAKGLSKAADGTAATALAAGKFAAAATYVYGASGEGADKLFDGNTATKCNMTSPVSRSDPSTWRVFTMRLADNAAPVVSYNFYTANDYVRRSPTDWLLEGSMDGIVWETLDERFFAPNAAWSTTIGSTAYNESSLQYKPFNYGTPFRLQETMRQPSASGKFFRFTFKKTCGNTILQLSELQLLDADGNNVARGLTKASNGTAATALEAGSFADAGSYSYGKSTEGSDKMFDDSPDTKMCATSNNMSGNAANYRVFTIRLADDAAAVCGYNFVTANDSPDRSPCDWTVEGSDDGETWTVLDERAGEPTPSSVYAAVNHGRPYAFTQIREPGALPAESVVTVDAGATLNIKDDAATIGRLRIDCTAGAGTINSFRPAAGGVLELVNVPAEADFSNYELPITVTGVQNAENLRSWTVTIDGASPSWVMLISVNETGRLVVKTAEYFYIRVTENEDAEQLSVPMQWIADNGVAGSGDSAQSVADALAGNGANGIPVWQSYCLGLDPQDAASTLLCEAAAGRRVFPAWR